MKVFTAGKHSSLLLKTVTLKKISFKAAKSTYNPFDSRTFPTMDDGKAPCLLVKSLLADRRFGQHSVKR
jgi:hypothetical protein